MLPPTTTTYGFNCADQQYQSSISDGSASHSGKKRIALLVRS